MKFIIRCIFMSMVVGSIGASAEMEHPIVNPKGVTEVVSPSIHFVGQLGLGLFDAWMTQNSFVMGPQYGYKLVGHLSVELPVYGDLSARLGGLLESRSIGVNQGG